MQTILKIILRYLPFVALIYLSLYLSDLQINLLLWPQNWAISGFSFTILTLVLFSRAIIWHRLLHRFGVMVPLKVAIQSYFRSVLAKFIPGKVWPLISRAEIIGRHGYSVKFIMFIGLVNQISGILSGLLVGMIGILYFDLMPDSLDLLLPVVLITGSATVMTAARRTMPIPRWVLNRFITADIQDRSTIKIPMIADIVGLQIINWGLMGLAYALLIDSLGQSVGWMPVLLQPLANISGILALVVPSGLGVREGVMVGYLMLASVSFTAATAIALTCRVWSLASELIVSIWGWLLVR